MIEMLRRQLPRPGILHVIEIHQPSGVLLIGEVFFAVLGALHPRVKFGDATDVLNAGVLDAAGIFVAPDLAAAPTRFDGASKRRVNRDAIPCHRGNNAIGFEREWLPLARALRVAWTRRDLV